jgi:hypothetical protein
LVEQRPILRHVNSSTISTADPREWHAAAAALQELASRRRVIVQNEGVGGLARGAVPFLLRLRTALFNVLSFGSAMLIITLAKE